MDKKGLGDDEKGILIRQLIKWAICVIATLLLYCVFGNIGILFALIFDYIIYRYA